MTVPNLDDAINILRTYKVYTFNLAPLQQAASIVMANNIRPLDIQRAMKILNDAEDNDEEAQEDAEELIDKAISDLQKIKAARERTK